MGFFGRQSTTPLNATAWGMGTNLIQPVLNFGAIQGQIDAADARQKQAFLDYQQTVLAAVENMENALSAYLSETTRNARLTAAADQSRQAATLVHQQYDSGYASFLDVLDAERTQLAAQSARSASDFALRENLVNVYAAAGGGWRDDARAQGDPK
jgi:multidrug efflux system outer membrane protein